MSDAERIGDWVRINSNQWRRTRTGKEIEGGAPGQLFCVVCGEPGQVLGMDGAPLDTLRWANLPGDGSWTQHMRCELHEPPLEWSYSGKS